jgi:hypothetical protein
MQGNAKERAKAIALPVAKSLHEMRSISQHCRELLHYWDEPVSRNAKYFREVDLRIIGGYAFTKMPVILRGGSVMTVLLLDGKSIKPKTALQMLYERTLSEISEGEQK